ncbi:hypothetical protein GMRT_14211 [Giardia muris]|uniref:Uncharacterized protein n=1 Tax=Giardia muris TaxID=5742 RepID=A0A4Z1SXJ7_GIAMU|nr:hypothetical protein GMRT_14211 [Giardia muris]|eukprot:TNJ30250.1 hypothetical protein GMRT_14211 [Giardia muris]
MPTPFQPPCGIKVEYEENAYTLGVLYPRFDETQTVLNPDELRERARLQELLARLRKPTTNRAVLLKSQYTIQRLKGESVYSSFSSIEWEEEDLEDKGLSPPTLEKDSGQQRMGIINHRMIKAQPSVSRVFQHYDKVIKRSLRAGKYPLMKDVDQSPMGQADEAIPKTWFLSPRTNVSQYYSTQYQVDSMDSRLFLSQP